MKKIIYLLSISFLLLQSCSSSSSDSDSSSSQLVGKWEAYKVGSFPPGTEITNSTTLVDYQFECQTPTFRDYWQFGSQGSFKAVTYNSSCAEGGGIGTYTKTDNILNIYQNNVLQVSMEIISLTSDILKVKFPSPATGTPDVIMVESFKKI